MENASHTKNKLSQGHLALIKMGNIGRIVPEINQMLTMLLISAHTKPYCNGIHTGFSDQNISPLSRSVVLQPFHLINFDFHFTQFPHISSCANNQAVAFVVLTGITEILPTLRPDRKNATRSTTSLAKWTRVFPYKMSAVVLRFVLRFENTKRYQKWYVSLALGYLRWFKKM